MRELRHSWPLAQVTPYELYLKTLYELVRDQLAGADAADSCCARRHHRRAHRVPGAGRPPGRADDPPLRRLLRRRRRGPGQVLHRRGHRQTLRAHHERARPLIICPAPLVEMWEHYNEAYQLNARVLSMGMLREDERSSAPTGCCYDERYRYRDFVLVDESHNFRNTDSQRYRVLQSFLSTGDRRVVLLTATPRNKSVWDIYHQLKLFHPEEITDLPIDPPHLRDYFKLVEAGERRLPELLSTCSSAGRGRTSCAGTATTPRPTARRPDNFAPYRSGERRAYVRVGGREAVLPRARTGDGRVQHRGDLRGLYDELRGYLGATPLTPRNTGERRDPDVGSDLRALRAVALRRPAEAGSGALRRPAAGGGQPARADARHALQALRVQRPRLPRDGGAVAAEPPRLPHRAG